MASLLRNFTSGNNMTCPLLSNECNDNIKLSEIDIDSYLFYKNVALTAIYRALNYIANHYYFDIAVLLVILMIYIVYKIYLDPLCYKKELTEVGYEHIQPGPGRMRRITRAQSLRRVGSKLPPPYPNGWFAVAESRDLKKGGVMAVNVLGKNFCVYRGEDGIAKVVDAYCPHLGAHLGIGGKVRENCIECPFHKWKFNAEGTCVAAPGMEIAPNFVSLKTWQSVEADGAVWVWHDVEGRAPLWQMEDAPECAHWGFRGRNQYMVSAHVQEIPENGADVAHLNAVHSSSLITDLGEKYPFLYNLIGYHAWNATWTRNGDHTASMTLAHDYKIFGYSCFYSELKITQNGPGHVRLRMQTPLGPFLFSQSVTPVGPMLQRITHRLFSPAYNAFFAQPLIISEGKMIERDIRIWNSKCFMSAPSYVKTDKTIRAFRNWFSQFYSDRSISFKDAMDPVDSLDW